MNCLTAQTQMLGHCGVYITCHVSIASTLLCPLDLVFSNPGLWHRWFPRGRWWWLFIWVSSVFFFVTTAVVFLVVTPIPDFSPRVVMTDSTYISAGDAVLTATAAKLSCEDACNFRMAYGVWERASLGIGLALFNSFWSCCRRWS